MTEKPKEKQKDLRPEGGTAHRHEDGEAEHAQAEKEFQNRSHSK